MTSFGIYNLSKMASFWISCKSLIQTTSFWISDLKHFQNDTILDSGCPKRHHFGMFAGFKKKRVGIQNDVVLAIVP